MEELRLGVAAPEMLALLFSIFVEAPLREDLLFRGIRPGLLHAAGAQMKRKMAPAMVMVPSIRKRYYHALRMGFMKTGFPDGVMV